MPRLSGLLLPVLACAAVLSLLPAQQAVVEEAATATTRQPVLCGRFEVRDDHRVLTLWGTPEERGFAHGWLLAETIVRNLDQDLQHLLRGSRKAAYENLVVKMLIPRFRFSDDEEAELKGMLRGIEERLPDEEQRTLSLLGRPLSLRDLKAANTVGDWMALGCSTFALDGRFTQDGMPAAGRNFDFTAFRMVLDDQHVVVNAPSEGRRGWVGVSYPGCLAPITGMNDAGVFVSIHDVWIKPSRIMALRKNVPRLCALRRLMTGLDADAALTTALEKLRRWPTLFGNNFMLVTPKADAAGHFAGVFEYDNRTGKQKGVHLRLLDHADADPAPWLLCTNHHRDREQSKDLTDICSRYDRLRAAVAESKGVQSIPSLFDTLSTASFPRNGRAQKRYRLGTTHQVVALLGKKELHVRFGEVGKNIRDIPPIRFSVEHLLAAARPPLQPK